MAQGVKRCAAVLVEQLEVAHAVSGEEWARHCALLEMRIVSVAGWTMESQLRTCFHSSPLRLKIP